jgi:hypothetical protein
MKRILIATLIVVGLCLIGWATYQVATPTPEERALAGFMPQGALVYLEAKDLSGLLGEWNASPEKAAWVKSDNYGVLSRSRLLLRLEQAQSQFAAAAGVPPDYTFLSEVAGKRSALGIYNIGKLELLYVTRLPSSSAMKSGLWQQRTKFEPRQSAGKQFFVRTEPESGRVVAFAIDGDYLVLGTREDLVAGALSLLAGQKLATLEQQNWYVDTVKSAKEPGDLRLLVHLSDVTKTPQFRSYWIQQNITELRHYESSISDLYRRGNEYREERALLLKPDAVAVSADCATAAGELARMVPADAGVFRSAANPPVEDVLAVLEQKVLTPRLGPAPPQKIAPTVTLGEGTVGSASSLETRIDVAPSQEPVNQGRGDEALKALLTSANVRAVMQAHRSEVAPDGVFVRLHSVVALSAAEDWKQVEVLKAIQQTIAPGMTAGALGASWKPGSGEQNYVELDGLTPVAIAIRGKLLIAGTDGAMVQAVLSRLAEKSKSEAVTYVAGFRHDTERENFYKMTSLLDRANRNNYTGQSNNQPEFFSQNIASLSRTLSGVRSETITMRRSGTTDLQTVRYEWTR